MTKHQYLEEFLKNGKFDNLDSVPKWIWDHEPLKSPQLFTRTGRHLNNFCIGSDPELCLQANGTKKYEAYASGMRVGLGAGCDQNERLVEFRPYPSKSVVEHIAGILTDFRWMYRVYGPGMRGPVIYRAGAFFDGDGMGGHVHFGRKRPTRNDEIAALDGLTKAFCAAKLFPLDEWDIRMKGDARGQQYGLLGDMRVQKHGYEYRTLPSWLQSPVLAFIVLTCSKLAVLNPRVTTPWQKNMTELEAKQKLKGLAKLYKGRDDDAYLLYHVLTRPGPDPFAVVYNGNCGTAWGIPTETPMFETVLPAILPACIKPTTDEVKEIQAHLLYGLPLDFVKTVPDFKTTVPEGYHWYPATCAPRRRSGFGDFLHDLVGSKKFTLSFDYTTAFSFGVYGHLPLCWNSAEKTLLKKYFPTIQITPREGHDTVITIPKDLCQAKTLPGLKAIVVKSGIFPLWTVETVTHNSLTKWSEIHPCKRTSVLQQM